jgi:hypothetical protein
MGTKASSLILRSRALRSVVTAKLAATLVLVATSWTARATQPKINWIQIPSYLPGYVLLHFDTDANRTYQVQYLDYAPTNGATWSVLATIPSDAAPQHYIWPDTLSPTRPRRFYRLQATP